MADCFLKLDQIAGESNDADSSLAGAIEVIDWTWGVEWSGELRSKGSAGHKGQARHFMFSHNLDSASPVLTSMCLNGKEIAKGELSIRRAGGTKAQTYVRMKFEKIRIVSVEQRLSDSVSMPLERVLFSFKRVEYEYRMQGDLGDDRGRVAKMAHTVDES